MSPSKHEQKSKAKPKSSLPSSTGNTSQDHKLPKDEGFSADLANAGGWNAVVSRLCDYLKLPDLSSRRGLKKVHQEFDSIFQALNGLYETYNDDDRVVGAVVGIYAKMCVDSILSKGLYEQDIISKIFLALDRPVCQQVALQALTAVTHHGSEEIRVAVASKTPVLTRLIRDPSSDPKTVELCVITLAHAILAVVASDDVISDPKSMKKIDIKGVFDVFLELVKKPTTSVLLLGHAHMFFVHAPRCFPKEFQACSPAIDYLVGSIRSKSIQTRSEAVLGIHSMNMSKRQIVDQSHIDPTKLMGRLQKYAISGTLPPFLDRLAEEEQGMSDIAIVMYTMKEYKVAIMKALQTGNMYDLGLKLATVILRTEFSIGDGYFDVEDPRTGRRTTATGLPFNRYLDALPLAASELRKRAKLYESSGKPQAATQHYDMADIISLKRLIMESKYDEVHTIAQKAIDRSPTVGYFYYALAIGKNNEDCLLITKRGLRRCRGSTTIGQYVKTSLHFLAGEAAAILGIEKITSIFNDGVMKDVDSWEQAVAYLVSAFEDLVYYVHEARVDQPRMRTAIYWTTIVLSLLKGDELGQAEYQNEIKNVLVRKLAIVDDASEFTGRASVDSQKRLTCKTILDRLERGTKDWSDVVTRMDTLMETNPDSTSSPFSPDTEKVEDYLAAWLEKFSLDDDQLEENNVNGSGKEKPDTEASSRSCQHIYRGHPKIVPNRVELYSCSYCLNPSAALKKCSRCGTCRYCDATCQKAHWSEHKALCKVKAYGLPNIVDI